MSISPLPPSPDVTAPRDETRLRAAARDLEAAFLAEMLRATGAGRQPGLGSGDGESPFASFLLEQRAKAMAEAGGIGLAEVLFDSLVRGDAGR